MKKGKRQIISKNVFAEASEQDTQTGDYLPDCSNQHEVILTDGMSQRDQTKNGSKSPFQTRQLQRQDQMERNLPSVASETTDDSNIVTKNQSLVEPSSSVAEEKKRKLALLKEKYMKKSSEASKEPANILANLSIKKGQATQKPIEEAGSLITASQISPPQHTSPTSQISLKSPTSVPHAEVEVPKKSVDKLNPPLPSQNLKQKVPPPPQRKPIKKADEAFGSTSESVSMEQFLTKKLRKQVEPASEQAEVAEPLNPFEGAYIINAPESKESALDREEYSQSKPSVVQKEVPIGPLEINVTVKDWLKEPLTTLANILHLEVDVLQQPHLKTHPPIQSKNRQFTPLFAKMVHSFILANPHQLTSLQKSVTYDVLMEYFYSDPKELNEIFLICLIKLGKEFLSKFSRVLTGDYLKRVALFRHLFKEEELAAFVDCLLDFNCHRQMDLVWMLLLSGGNERLLSEIINGSFNSEITMVAILCLCRWQNRKQLVGVYIRLIGNMTHVFVREQMVEQVLQLLKEMEIPEKWYNVSKQLKLKLLGMLGERQEETNEGLFSYFNKFNKAVTKIASLATEKPVEVEQQKNSIAYDPELKRYLINGKVLEEEGESESVKKVIPPPPPRRNRQTTDTVPPQGRRPLPNTLGTRYV